MLSTASIGHVEVRNVHEGLLSDVRADGRTLLQRRPFAISATHTRGLEDGTTYNGSSVAVTMGGGTAVLAAASPSVVEVAEGAGGPLHVTIDAAPAVVDWHASALGGRSGQYRRAFLSHAALTIRNVFGAESVSVEGHQSGVAEAQAVPEEGAEEGAAAEEQPMQAVGGRLPCGYPADSLVVGAGHAFRIDVDVHVQQASAGALLPCIALAVHAALRAVRLPSVSLHSAASGTSVEVDRSRPFERPVDWAQLPLLAELLLSPTRQYLVDPTAEEELALPQQLHVAANRDGHITFTRYCQYPSRSGGDRLDIGGRGPATDATGSYAAGFELSPTDLLAAVSDATHICAAMIADCDAAIGAMAEH